MNVEETITRINNANLQTNDDLRDIELLLDSEKNSLLIEPLFRLLERFPYFQFGNPGNIVRYLESFSDDVYVPILYASVQRVPTEYNIWMLNRLLNSLDEEEKQEGVNLMKEALEKDIDDSLQESIKEFLEDHKEE